MPESKGLVVATSTCFITALVISIVAVVTPAWITESFNGLSEYGVISTCSEIKYGEESKRTCTASSDVPREWQATAAMVIIGCFLIAAAVVYTFLSTFRSQHLKTARWCAFIASILFSIASLIFPVGFKDDLIGGEAYKLPEYTQVGYSYVLFVAAILMVFIGELFAIKILCFQ